LDNGAVKEFICFVPEVLGRCLGSGSRLGSSFIEPLTCLVQAVDIRLCAGSRGPVCCVALKNTANFIGLGNVTHGGHLNPGAPVGDNFDDPERLQSVQRFPDGHPADSVFFGQPLLADPGADAEFSVADSFLQGVDQ
jgi:hypothetical protein